MLCHLDRSEAKWRDLTKFNKRTMKTYSVYMITNWTNEVLYIGVTSDLEKRIYEHKTGQHEGFSKKYNLKKMVYCEDYSDVNEALAREKQLKNWSRKKKDRLVEQMNPEWDDLSGG